ncbi:hypothetical protein X801_06259, partial [Opisthorchis viverrini]
VRSDKYSIELGHLVCAQQFTTDTQHHHHRQHDEKSRVKKALRLTPCHERMCSDSANQHAIAEAQMFGEYSQFLLDPCCRSDEGVFFSSTIVNISGKPFLTALCGRIGRSRRGYGKNRRNEVKGSGSSTRHARRTQRGDIIHKLAKRVYRMVDEDNRKHIDSKRPSLENTVPSCGCPLNCGAELQKLRDYVNRLHPLLSENNQDNLQQLECFCDVPERLLLEAWTIIGAQKLKELLTEDL